MSPRRSALLALATLTVGIAAVAAVPAKPAARATDATFATSPSEAGQATFAAISEIVTILSQDPATDWSRVDIGALREHLVDMNRVMVDAHVVQRPIDEGVEMTVTGSEPVMASARRMIEAHSAMVGAAHGWKVAVEGRGDALVVSWTTPRPEEVPRLRGLGFFGFMVDGSHHQQHHLMIATGMNPHAGMR